MQERSYIDWYDARPTWVRTLLFPFVLPVVLIHSLIAGGICFGLVLPYVWAKDWCSNFWFWRRLRRMGRVAQWADVEPRINAGAAILVVEICAKGPACAWLVACPRAAVDPDASLPTWADYEAHEYEVFDQQVGGVSCDEFLANQLRPFESTALWLTPSPSELRGLPEAIQKSSVLVTTSLWRNGRRWGDATAESRPT